MRSAGPCQTWEPIWCQELPLDTAAISGVALTVATEILWSKSGRQFDSCTHTLRPCARDCWNDVMPFADREFQHGWPFPYNRGGQWFNLGCGGCPGTCSCSVIYEAKMPPDIASIVEIKIDGAELVSGAYRVYDFTSLVRTDGQPWPHCNDLNLDDTEVGTWSVTATFGVEVPSLGQMAVGELAREIALSCVGSSRCKLPRSVQSIVRQGVSLQFFDPTQVFPGKMVGLTLSDHFISTFNPQGIQRRAWVMDVDGPGTRRQTWPP